MFRILSLWIGYILKFCEIRMVASYVAHNENFHLSLWFDRLMKHFVTALLLNFASWLKKNHPLSGSLGWPKFQLLLYLTISIHIDMRFRIKYPQSYFNVRILYLCFNYILIFFILMQTVGPICHSIQFY